MVVKYIIPALLVGLVWFFSIKWLGLGAGVVLGAVFSVGLAYFLKQLKIPFFQKLPALKKPLPTLLMVGALFVFVTSTVVGSGLWGQVGDITGFAVAEPAIIPGIAVTCAVPTELSDEAITVTPKAFDRESGSNTALTGMNIGVYKSGTTSPAIVDASDTTTTFSAQAGTVIDVMGGGNTSYYIMTATGQCINEQGQIIELDAHASVADNNLVTSGYDETGSTALTTGTTNEENYEIALGASQEKKFYQKTEVNVADASYRFCGYGVMYNGDVDNIEPRDGDELEWAVTLTYTREGPAKFLKDADIMYNQTSAGNISGYDYFWRAVEGPQLMTEWQSIKQGFTISADSDGTDALDGASSASTGDYWAITALDCAWAEGADGYMFDDYYVHSQDETNAGVAEDVNDMYAKDAGFFGEAS